MTASEVQSRSLASPPGVKNTAQSTVRIPDTTRSLRLERRAEVEDTGLLDLQPVELSESGPEREQWVPGEEQTVHNILGLR